MSQNLNKLIALFLLSSTILVESSQTTNLNRASVISEPEKLVKIDIKHNQEVKLLAQPGICLISTFDDFVLARCNSKRITHLKPLGFNYTILDDIYSNHEYYYIWAIDHEAEKAIPHFCKVLYRNNEFFLVRLDETTLEKLIRFRVELAKITLDPMIITETTKGYYPVNYNSVVQEIVDRVDSDSVLGFVRRLCNFQTRYSTTDSCRAAADYIKNQLETYGMDSVYQQTFRPDYAPNVIGIKQGTVYPESIYTVVCGHFDCTSRENPLVFAPGADDNGSGSAAVLEAARVMQGYSFEYTIKFIGFSGEEQGLHGSNYYANQARMRGDSILGVINVDMVAYALPDRDSASIIGNPSEPNCEPLVDYFIACADTYTLLKTQRRIMVRPNSDHASFNQCDYLAIHCRENLNVPNPYYHTMGDTIGAGFNSLEFCSEAIKASVATVACLAIPQTVGLSDKNFRRKPAENKIKIFPNPSSKVLWVINNLNSSENIEIKIYDVCGKIIKSLNKSTDAKLIRLDIGSLASGVYFIKLTNGSETAKRKIIIR